VTPLRLVGNIRFFWKTIRIVYTDGCMVRRRPRTTQKEKTKGQRARTVDSAHGLVPARKAIFLLVGKDYSLDRCPLMGTKDD